MIGDGIEATVRGIPDYREALAAIPVKLRRSTLRNALAAGARIVRDAAISIRSSTSGSPLTGNPVTSYKRGTVARAIRVRTSKRDRAAGDVGVYVNVRPLPRAQRSRHNPDDPFYWRWLEFGTKFMRKLPFLTPAASRLNQALAKFIAVLGPKLQRLNENAKDPMT